MDNILKPANKTKKQYGDRFIPKKMESNLYDLY